MNIPNIIKFKKFYCENKVIYYANCFSHLITANSNKYWGNTPQATLEWFHILYGLFLMPGILSERSENIFNF
jgi:hypothetical protein